MPARFRDLKRALEKLNCVVEEPSSGSHWKVRRHGKMFPNPARMKAEVPDVYVRGVCRALGLDEAALRALL